MMGVAVTALAFGQSSNIAKSTSTAKSVDVATELTVTPAPTTTNVSSRSNGTAAQGTVWFSETFGMGLAGDGTNGAWTTNGTVANATPDPDAVWEYRGPSTTPDNTIGSRGQWSGTQDPVASPTAANGFFIFDSDYLDTKGTGAGNGDAITPHKSWLISPTFSTVGSNSVTINFTTYFRRFQGTCYVLLSTDNGSTWGDSVVVFDADWAVNDASATDLVINEAIPFLENQATAKIAFFFDGETESNVNGSGYYFAMVDDVVLSDLADNDLVIGNVNYQSGYDTAWNAYYSQVPAVFASYDSVQFSGWATNQGGVAQENVKFNNVVSYNGAMQTTMSSPAGLNQAVGASDSLVADGWFKFDQGVGEYSWAYSVSSDSTDDVPSNNMKDTVFVSLTDSTYARDAGATGNFWYGAGNTYEIGVSFDVYETVQATSVSVAVGASSTAGSSISVYIYDLSTDLSTPLTSSEFHVLDAATVGDLVSYEVPGVLLTPGTYLVTYKTYTDDVYFRVSDYDGNQGMAYVDQNGAAAWGWTTSIPAVRLNVSTDLYVCDLMATAVQTGNNSALVSYTGTAGGETILWDNGETTAAVTNLTSAVGVGMPHTVTVTDDSNCVSTATVNIVSGLVEAGIEGDVSISPNPNNGNFQLNLENVAAGKYTLLVKNSIGQEVYNNVVSVNGNYNGTVSLSNLESGFYFMDITNAKGEKSVINFIVK